MIHGRDVFPVINCDTGSGKVPVHYNGEESMSNISRTPLPSPYGTNMPFSAHPYRMSD
jgi:hypothetical protein